VKNKQSSGFTLIEIMVVVAVIGILVSISIPLFHSYREKANISDTVSNIYHLMLFENQFFNTNTEFTSIAVADKQADGTISKNATLKDGSSVPFIISSLSRNVDIAVNTDTSKQTIIVGGKHPGTSSILALDLEEGSKYHQKHSTVVFTASQLPVATFANDLSSWPTYQK